MPVRCGPWQLEHAGMLLAASPCVTRDSPRSSNSLLTVGPPAPAAEAAARRNILRSALGNRREDRRAGFHRRVVSPPGVECMKLVRKIAAWLAGEAREIGVVRPLTLRAVTGSAGQNMRRHRVWRLLGGSRKSRAWSKQAEAEQSGGKPAPYHSPRRHPKVVAQQFLGALFSIEANPTPRGTALLLRNSCAKLCAGQLATGALLAPSPPRRGADRCRSDFTEATRALVQTAGSGPL